MQYQRRNQALGAVVLIGAATLFLWAVFRPYSDLQKMYGLLLGLLGQAAGMAILLLAERIHVPLSIRPPKALAVMCSLALLIGIVVAFSLFESPHPLPPVPGDAPSDKSGRHKTRLLAGAHARGCKPAPTLAGAPRRV